MKPQRFKAGDTVRIINYGRQYFKKENGVTKIYDFQPELIGTEAVVKGSYNDLYGDMSGYDERNNNEYALNIGSWFYDNQLELVISE